jgi:hypothetical protein
LPVQVKCQQCGGKEPYYEETHTLYVHITSGGKEQKKYYHKKCFAELPKDEEGNIEKVRKFNATCQHCGGKEPYNKEVHDLKIYTTKGGQEQKRYFHRKCLNKYEKEEAFKNKEQEELDKLVKVVGEIHDAPKPPNLAYQLPRIWYHMIQDIRNGTNRYTKNMKKRYKKGIPYNVIVEAYKLAKDGIKWSKMDKQFKDTASEIRYGLAIVNNKIPDALKKIERDRHMDKINKIREEEELQDMEYERETVYKKKKASYDISDLFD